MPTCAVLNCHNRKDRKVTVDRRSFHKFPFRDPDLLEKWIQALGRKNWKPNKSSLICCDHFEDSCFDKFQQSIRLRRGSVPTKFGFTRQIIKEEENTTDSPKKIRFCVAKGCNSVRWTNGLTFFCFPKDPIRCQLWVEFCNNDDLKGLDTMYLHKYVSLCGKHFSISDYDMNSKKKRLLENAIPTIFVNEENEENATRETTKEGVSKCTVKRNDNKIRPVASVRCAAKGCKSSKNEKVTYYRFPDNKVLCRKWLQRIGISEKMMEDLKTFRQKYRLCSKHFEQTQLTFKSQKRRPSSRASSDSEDGTEDDKSSLNIDLQLPTNDESDECEEDYVTEEWVYSDNNVEEEGPSQPIVITVPSVRETNVGGQKFLRRRKVGLDVNSICRLCLRSNRPMKSIYMQDEATMNTLYEVLQVTANRDDGLPQQICNACFFSLDTAYMFKKMCYENLTYLANTLRPEGSSSAFLEDGFLEET